MKKIVSLVLTIVLMASMFAMLGTVTASAETYDVTNVLVNLTFDGDAPYGIVAHRSATIEYATDEGYLILKNSGTGNSSAYIGVDGTVGKDPVNATKTNNIDEFTATQLEAYNNLFKFKAGKTYRVTYDIKFLAGTDGTKRHTGNMVMSNPLLKTADSVRNFSTRTIGYTSNVSKDISWTPVEGKLAEDTEWLTITHECTTKDDETGCALGVTPGQGLDNDVNVAADTFTAFDNIRIVELVGEYSYSESDVYTLDDQPAFTKASGPEGTYVENYEDHGTVLKVEGTATSDRGGFKIDDFKVEKGKKYYISFEAKADAAGEISNVLCDYAAPFNRRHFMSGYNSKYQGVKYFINGTEITVNSEQKKNVMPVTTEWQTYGLTIDTADEGFLDAVLSNGRENTHYIKFWNYNIYYMFGSNTTTYFDNFKIVAVEEVDSVVPEKDASAKYSIRETAAGTTAGLRFRGSVANNVKETADEIGFVVAPASLVGGNDNWYKLDSLSIAAKKVVAYDGTKDVVYSSDAETTSYQLILTKLDNIVAHRFAAVMYVKTGNTYEYISLGEISYNQVLAEYAVRGK